MIQNIKKIDFSYRSKSMVAQWGDELGSAMMKWVISAWASREYGIAYFIIVESLEIGNS